MFLIIQSDQKSGFVLRALNRFFGSLFTLTIRMIRKKRNGFFFVEWFLFLAFPVLDETIQLYSPGRGSSVSDVLIDFVSCVVGMGLCCLIFKPKVGVECFGAPAVQTELTGTAKNRIRRRIFTVITLLFVLFIFHNSMFPGPQSSSQSQYVMNLLNHMLGALRSPVSLSEHFVRKADHFTEYFALGIIMLITVRSYHKPVRNSLFAGMFFLLLIPVIDEFIQLFTPQRGSSVLDVLLDFGGGIAGMLLCHLACHLKHRTI